MMVMPSSHSSALIHYWIGQGHPLGWLFGPQSAAKKKLRPWIKYACDNDAFTAWVAKTPWNESAFFDMLENLTDEPTKPLWVLVPDVVADKRATLTSWYRYAPRVAEYGWPLAFAVQDGMTPSDVPENADVVFIGGTTEWKWRNLQTFCNAFPRVHCGRVNTTDRLWRCADLGCESVDGTKWFRRGVESHYMTELEQFFKGQRLAELALA